MGAIKQFEDIVAWLDLEDIRYSPKIKFTGKTGYDHMFDFVIPKSRIQPERIIQTLSSPKKDSAEALVFKWLDTRETRPVDSKLYAFLNDTNSPYLAPLSVLEISDEPYFLLIPFMIEPYCFSKSTNSGSIALTLSLAGSPV